VHDPGSPQDHGASPCSVAEHEISCQQFVEVITDYLEGALANRTLTHVEEHLVLCDWCVTYLEQMQQTVEALHALDGEPPPEPSERVLIALRANARKAR
jgi:predicted anti-sigma-YlaC factor YlaD